MRKEKQLLLDEIKEKIDASPSFILMNYEKMSANVANDFRAVLDKAKGEFEVISKRILLKAFETASIGVNGTMLEAFSNMLSLQAAICVCEKKFSRKLADLKTFQSQRESILCSVTTFVTSLENMEKASFYC